MSTSYFEQNVEVTIDYDDIWNDIRDNFGLPDVIDNFGADADDLARYIIGEGNAKEFAQQAWSAMDDSDKQSFKEDNDLCEDYGLDSAPADMLANKLFSKCDPEWLFKRVVSSEDSYWREAVMKLFAKTEELSEEDLMAECIKHLRSRPSDLVDFLKRLFA